LKFHSVLFAGIGIATLFIVPLPLVKIISIISHFLQDILTSATSQWKSQHTVSLLFFFTITNVALHQFSLVMLDMSVSS
jgi:hypothetical protein